MEEILGDIILNWTLTWDVFKSSKFFNLLDFFFNWTLTWDVFKWKEVIHMQKKNIIEL